MFQKFVDMCFKIYFFNNQNLVYLCKFLWWDKENWRC